MAKRVPDVTLMDMSLPEESGTELADEFRNGGLKTPILFMSGYPSDELPERLRSGGPAYLQKPFSPDELLEAISDVLQATPGTRAG